MAKGAELVLGGCPPHTIYVKPSRVLIAQSRRWPLGWHSAYERLVQQLSRQVAQLVLNGLPITRQPRDGHLPAGWVMFRVACEGTRIWITVLNFEPVAPGPGDGTRAHRPADRFILGVRGSGKGITLVTFYRPLPPIPAGRSMFAACRRATMPPTGAASENNAPSPRRPATAETACRVPSAIVEAGAAAHSSRGNRAVHGGLAPRFANAASQKRPTPPNTYFGSRRLMVIFTPPAAAPKTARIAKPLVLMSHMPMDMSSGARRGPTGRVAPAEA
jgi:hypothetical protein